MYFKLSSQIDLGKTCAFVEYRVLGIPEVVPAQEIIIQSPPVQLPNIRWYKKIWQFLQRRYIIKRQGFKLSLQREL